MIEKTIALNLKEEIIDDNFTFNTYTSEDIKNKLARIKLIYHD
jgi:hypothetical protein